MPDAGVEPDVVALSKFGGFHKIRGTLLGVPILRTIVYWGSILGSPCFGKVPFGALAHLPVRLL